MSVHKNVWVMTLECGHLCFSGPWREAEQQHWPGDITVCEVCPRAVEAGRRVLAARYIMIVTPVPSGQYRDANPLSARTRLNQQFA